MIIFASDFTLVLPIWLQSYKKNIRLQTKKTKNNMGREQITQQESINTPILDKDLERKLLACNLVDKIKRFPDHVSITLTGEGVIELVKAFLASMREDVPGTRFIPSGNSIIAVTDAALISQKELVTELKMNINHLIALQRQGKLTPVKVGGRRYYKRSELENITIPYNGQKKL